MQRLHINIFVMPHPADIDAAFQPVDLRQAVGQKIIRVADRLILQVRAKPIGQRKTAVGEQIAARAPRHQIVARHRATH
ncbi:hypothetical protein GALL_509810 [mine drainage metagenome]|uniref:Uncharacterized protein n=1 Tax=mine drainage metagenome TaxID=410659 RepID=A0A1J5P9M3_9ZZZZ